VAAETAPAAAVAGGSRVRLRPLTERRDGDDWVIGRAETGDFIAVPDVAHRVLALLRQDKSVDEVAAELRAQSGKSFAVADFVAALDGLGFVAAVDDDLRADQAAPAPSLPWLRPAHVRWLLHPAAAAVAAALTAAAVILLATHPALLPRYGTLVWSPHAGIVLAVNAAIAWVLILLHELAHLATARAAGAPARITLSTRLQFLTAQTDVSGVWGAPRRIRMTVYLAGISLDLSIVGTCLLVVVLAGPHGLPRTLLLVAVTETLLGLATQLMVFMRTDFYFVLQDLTRCANLYADGTAYLRHLARRVWARGTVPGDGPGQGYPAAQRRAIRGYSAVLLIGTLACVGLEFTVSLPALIALIARAAAEIGTAALASLDGAVLIVILTGWLAMWCARWWARHREQVGALTRRLHRHDDPARGVRSPIATERR
jgi:putative peptide zinc metalloprotease protein